MKINLFKYGRRDDSDFFAGEGQRSKVVIAVKLIPRLSSLTGISGRALLTMLFLILPLELSVRDAHSRHEVRNNLTHFYHLL